MKQCPRCNQTYSDETLNFCLNDGELLTMFQPEPGAYMDPPTMVMDQARVTDPIHGWQQQQAQAAQPPAQWQQPQMQNFGGYPMAAAPNQTLATVSLCLGVASLTIGWCCSSGILLGPAAIVVGLIAKSNIRKDPDKFTGSGMATAGIITGSVFIALYILIIVIYGIAAIGGALGGR
ncbi:MAG TPA: DUF4190 domain-containing protein [Pyrinomonadaceae bacterium]|nr:DUF4190 domain-containing protein [Pyrinomonadaceae bacterium]